jgi:hypothetical protein
MKMSVFCDTTPFTPLNSAEVSGKHIYYTPSLEDTPKIESTAIPSQLGETEFTWYVGHYFAYCTSAG